MRDATTGVETGREIMGGLVRKSLGTALMPWPDDVFIQGGLKGTVFHTDPAPDEPAVYQTAFVEVMPKMEGGTFLRGEGATIVDAEADCWAAYQRWLHCPGPTGEHSWKPGYTSKNSRKWVAYRNGGAFCEHCGAFSSKRFTAEQLGQFCAVCNTPTTWHYHTEPDGTVTFLCEAHAEDPDTRWLREHGEDSIETGEDSE